MQLILLNLQNPAFLPILKILNSGIAIKFDQVILISSKRSSGFVTANRDEVYNYD